MVGDSSCTPLPSRVPLSAATPRWASGPPAPACLKREAQKDPRPPSLTLPLHLLDGLEVPRLQQFWLPLLRGFGNPYPGAPSGAGCWVRGPILGRTLVSGLLVQSLLHPKSRRGHCVEPHIYSVPKKPRARVAYLA
jgi:hypothetical protein